jgi:hypothetical protein
MLHRITSYDCPVRTIEIARGFQQTVEVMEQSTPCRFAQPSSTAGDPGAGKQTLADYSGGRPAAEVQFEGDPAAQFSQFGEWPHEYLIKPP